MRILLVADVSIKKLLGGAERGLYEGALFLYKQGHDVNILTRLLDSHTTDFEIIDGIKEFRYKIDNSNPFRFFKSIIINSQNKCKTLLKDKTFDLINFHQPFGAFALCELHQLKNVKKVYTCHSLSYEEFISRHKQKKSLDFWFQVFVRRFIERHALVKSDKIIVLSQFTKDKLTQTYQLPDSKISIIPGGVNIDRFKLPSDKKQLRHELNLNNIQLILFTARNLVPRMGLENLIKSIAILVRQNTNPYLFIGGQGPLKEDLQHLILKLNLSDHVKLGGFISDELLVKYYQAADFFILPTVELEGFGLVTIESMSCGTPVLATPIGGSIEILSKFDQSFLFKDISSESMAELILNKYSIYKNDTYEYDKLSISLRHFIEEHYSSKNNVSKIEEFFKNLIKG